MRRLVALVALAPLLAVLPASTSASAAEQAPAGWWYQPQQLPSTVPAAVPAPPYVGSGQLLVEGTGAAPNAVAAVRLQVPSGSTAGLLTLPVASARGVPVVTACRALSGWAPVETGRWELRPRCDGPAVVLALSADGTTLSGPVGTLVREGVLDVVLEPAATDPFSVTLAALTIDVLATSAAAPVETPAPAAEEAAAPAPDAPVEAPTAPEQPPVDTPQDVPGTAVLPAVEAPPAAPETVAPQAPAVAAPQALPRTVAARPGDDEARRLALVLLALVAGTAALLSQGRARLPRPLVAVAGSASAPPSSAPPSPASPLRGVGRFRSARTGTPPVRL